MSHQISASEANLVIRWAEVPDGSHWAFFPSEVLAVPLGDTPGAGVVPISAMPVGRVLVRVSVGTHGRNSFLSTDALFTRWDGVNGQAWSQDRKASPVIAPIGSGGPVTGGSGRTPDTRAFEESKNITFMGPVEHKWRNPYGITVRGAGLGIKAALTDNFFFSGDHYHASHHRGVNVPLGSTRIYDFRRAKPNEEGSPVGVPDEAMSAGLDTMTIVVPQAAGNAGGDPVQNTLASNFSGDTGPGFGAAAFKVDGSRSSDGRLRMIVGYRSYEKYGPFSGGALRGDKHLEGINREGNPVQVAHIHIGAKLTDDSTFYDGRQHIDPVIEPNCGAGGLPVRVYNQFRPKYPDDYFFQTLNGVYDYHTRIPFGMVTIDPTPNKQPEDGDPTPNKQPEDGDPSPNKVDDPGDPTPRKRDDEDPTPNKEPGRPVIDPGDVVGEDAEPTLEFPGATGGQGGGGDSGDGTGAPRPMPELPPDWHGKPSGQATLPPAEPPTAWGPCEIAAPSLEFQPMLGNTAPPTRARLTPDSVDLHGAPYALSSEEMRARQEAQTQEERIDNVTVDITGATTSDHFKAPFTGHFEAYYKHKFATPQGIGRSLKNFPPSYKRNPKLKLGQSWDKPDVWERGAADGLVLFCGPENKPWRNRHDYAGPVEAFTTVQTLGIYTGHLLGFGKASTDWASIVSGVRIGLNGTDRLNFAFVDASGSPVAGALQVNGVDIGGGALTFPVAAPDDGVANYAFDAGTTPGSENAGMGFTPAEEGPSLFDIAGAAQLKISTAGVEIPNKLTVGGLIDPTGLVLTEQASTPWAFAPGYGALYVKDTAPSTLVFVDDTGAEVTLGSGAGGPADQLDADGDTLDVDSISDGQYLRRVATSIVGENAIPRVVTAQFGGPGGSITAGDTAWTRVPFSGTITKATLLADVSGSIVVDVWKDTYANYPPTVADTIAASAKPTLSSAIKSEDSTLTGWTTAVTAGDVLKFKVDSVATVTHVTLILEITP